MTDAATRKLGHPRTSLEARAALRAAHRLHGEGRLRLTQRKPAYGGRTQWTISDTAGRARPDLGTDQSVATAAMDQADRLHRQLDELQTSSQQLQPRLLSTDATHRLATAIQAAQADLEALRTKLDPT